MSDALADRQHLLRELATLRARLEQAERDMAEIHKPAFEAGFRAGIESAYEVSGKYHQITHVREAIRALAAQKGNE